MDFALTEEQSMLRDSLRRYVEKEYAFEARRQLIEQAGGFRRAHWNAYAEMGWLGIGLPEASGGFGGDLSDSAILLEEFGRGLVVEPYAASHIQASRLLLHSGDARAAELIEALIAGSTLYAVAHNEPGARGRSLWVETRAAATGGGSRISGTKTQVLAAPSADRFLVSARSEQGLSLFLIDRDTPGMSLREYRLVDGSQAADLSFDQLLLPESALLGAAGKADSAIDLAISAATIACCAEMVGAMEQALWITRDYLRTRKQFGVAIGSFQALQHRMADMYIALEQARSMLYRGLAYAEDGDAIRRRGAVSASKAQVGRSAQYIAAQAVQLHGGIGLTNEYCIGHYFKRLLVLEAAYGSSAYHVGVVAQQLRDAA
ncbi:MAG: acyl-CoA dehydrogenase [Hydrocarboniphaga sp.]|uniref:acyl-CoA dehydrogenase family protein n=1 Tax=Hydrocarboniphaga sp. TaxID=2033016 RepID=UPI0026199C92|nr:acyl-CoA dehydrogenase family protein [Hydrocarboniphaga sp.]MDB5972462.1 acyl-CoA dehydrogenase [Hydrocarboniphaga sp.]